jgi:hypothetical protein
MDDAAILSRLDVIIWRRCLALRGCSRAAHHTASNMGACAFTQGYAHDWSVCVNVGKIYG